MSQVIDIRVFTFDSLENNEIVLESLSINNGNRSTFPSLSSPSDIQAYNHLTTRPSDEFQKSFAYTSIRRLCSISMRFLFILLTLIIPAFCKNR